jgi:hypothetical protein
MCCEGTSSPCSHIQLARAIGRIVVLDRLISRFPAVVDGDHGLVVLHGHLLEVQSTSQIIPGVGTSVVSVRDFNQANIASVRYFAEHEY